MTKGRIETEQDPMGSSCVQKLFSVPPLLPVSFFFFVEKVLSSSSSLTFKEQIQEVVNSRSDERQKQRKSC